MLVILNKNKILILFLNCQKSNEFLWFFLFMQKKMFFFCKCIILHFVSKIMLNYSFWNTALPQFLKNFTFMNIWNNYFKKWFVFLITILLKLNLKDSNLYTLITKELFCDTFWIYNLSNKIILKNSILFDSVNNELLCHVMKIFLINLSCFQWFKLG